MKWGRKSHFITGTQISRYVSEEIDLSGPLYYTKAMLSQRRQARKEKQEKKMTPGMKRVYLN
jgi:hypothetical protein